MANPDGNEIKTVHLGLPTWTDEFKKKAMEAL